MTDAFHIAKSLFFTEDDPGNVFYIHRGELDHIDDDICPCSPLVLTQAQVRAYTLSELTSTIQTFLTPN